MYNKNTSKIIDKIKSDIDKIRESEGKSLSESKVDIVSYSKCRDIILKHNENTKNEQSKHTVKDSKSNAEYEQIMIRQKYMNFRKTHNALALSQDPDVNVSTIKSKMTNSEVKLDTQEFRKPWKKLSQASKTNRLIRYSKQMCVSKGDQAIIRHLQNLLIRRMKQQNLFDDCVEYDEEYGEIKLIKGLKFMDKNSKYIMNFDIEIPQVRVTKLSDSKHNTRTELGDINSNIKHQGKKSCHKHSSKK